MGSPFATARRLRTAPNDAPQAPSRASFSFASLPGQMHKCPLVRKLSRSFGAAGCPLLRSGAFMRGRPDARLLTCAYAVAGNSVRSSLLAFLGVAPTASRDRYRIGLSERHTASLTRNNPSYSSRRATSRAQTRTCEGPFESP